MQTIKQTLTKLHEPFKIINKTIKTYENQKQTYTNH